MRQHTEIKYEQWLAPNRPGSACATCSACGSVLKWYLAAAVLISMLYLLVAPAQAQTQTVAAIDGPFEDGIFSAGCFIAASAGEFTGIAVLFGLCMTAFTIGLKMVLRASAAHARRRRPTERFAGHRGRCVIL